MLVSPARLDACRTSGVTTLDPVVTEERVDASAGATSGEDMMNSEDEALVGRVVRSDLQQGRGIPSQTALSNHINYIIKDH